MLYDVIEVKFIEDCILFLRFEDGLEGNIDISKIIPFEGIFSKFKDQKYFCTVELNKDIGTIVWDNGADVSPAYLYNAISNKSA